MPTKIFLIIIVIISVLLHFYHINNPQFPVFDEMHYATYASKYAHGKPHIDAHPPLGKLIYAIPLLFQKDSSATDISFIEQYYDQNKKKIASPTHFGPYGDFPYISLRFISAAFGIALPILVYFFIRAVAASEIAALFGVFFITLENGLLLESRLALLNPMYLTLGIAALVCMMQKVKSKQSIIRSMFGGIFFGMAMSVKWIAIVFLGPIIFSYLMSSLRSRLVGRSNLITSDVLRDSTSQTLASNRQMEVEPRYIELRSIFIFFLTAIAVFLIIQIPIQNMFVPAANRVAYYESMIPLLAKTPADASNIFIAAKAFFTELIIMLIAYTTNVQWDPDLSSAWFVWPLMGTPMIYTLTEPFIILVGNPFVWFAGTAATLIVLWRFVRYLMSRGRMSKTLTSIFGISDLIILKQSYVILLFSYFFSLLPFLLVNRATFLYHYFPALIFAVCLAAILFAEIIKSKVNNQKSIINSQWSIYGQWSMVIVIIVLTLLGFALSAPYIYG